MLSAVSRARSAARAGLSTLVVFSVMWLALLPAQAQGEQPAATPIAATSEPAAPLAVTPDLAAADANDTAAAAPITPGVAAAAGPDAGTGSVLVQVIECNDPARQGQTDFFVSEPVAAADADTSGPCSNRRVNGADYTLRGVSVPYARTLSGRDGFIFFPDLAPGTYQLGSDATDARSTAFAVRAFEGTDIVVYEFDGFLPDTGTPPNDDPTAPATATVRVDLCDEPSRGGDTDFRILTSRNVVAPDFADTNRPGSIAARCRFARAGEVTVVLTNLGTGEERQATTDSFGGAGFGADIPPGAYTLRVGDAISTSFTLEPGGFIAAAIYLFRAPDLTPTATPSLPTHAPSTTTPPTNAVTTPPHPAPTATAVASNTLTHHDAAPTATASSALHVTTLPSTGGAYSGGTALPWLALFLAAGLLVAAVRTARNGR